MKMISSSHLVLRRQSRLHGCARCLSSVSSSASPKMCSSAPPGSPHSDDFLPDSEAPAFAKDDAARHATVARTRMIRNLTRTGSFHEAVEAFEHFDPQLVDAHLRGAAISACLKAGWWRRGLGIFDQAPSVQKNSQLTSMALSAIERTMARDRGAEDGDRAYDSVSSHHDPVEQQSLEALAARADALFEDLQQRDAQKCDVFVYTNMVTVHSRAGNAEKALQYFEALKQRVSAQQSLLLQSGAGGAPIRLSAVAYTAAIAACARGGGEWDGRGDVLLPQVWCDRAWGIWAELKAWLVGTTTANPPRTRLDGCGDDVVFGRGAEPPPRSSSAPRPPLQAYSAILAVCARARAWDRVSSLYEELKRTRRRLDPMLVSALIQAFVKADRPHCALVIFENSVFENDQGAVGVEWTGVATAAISACEKSRQGERALKIFKTIKTPDSMAVAAIVSCCEKTGLYAAGMEVFETRVRSAESSGPERGRGSLVNRVCYGAAIRLCEKAGEPERAVRLLERIEGAGVDGGGGGALAQERPDADTYRDALSCCEAHGRWDLAVPILRRLEAAYFQALGEDSAGDEDQRRTCVIFGRSGRPDVFGSACLQVLGRYGWVTERILSRLAERMRIADEGRPPKIFATPRQLLAVWEAVAESKSFDDIITRSCEAPPMPRKNTSNMVRWAITENCITRLAAAGPALFPPDVALRLLHYALAEQEARQRLQNGKAPWTSPSGSGSTSSGRSGSDSSQDEWSHSEPRRRRQEARLDSLVAAGRKQLFLLQGLLEAMMKDMIDVPPKVVLDGSEVGSRVLSKSFRSVEKFVSDHDVKSLGLRPTADLLGALGFQVESRRSSSFQKFVSRARRAIGRTVVEQSARGHEKHHRREISSPAGDQSHPVLVRRLGRTTAISPSADADEELLPSSWSTPSDHPAEQVVPVRRPVVSTDIFVYVEQGESPPDNDKPDEDSDSPDCSNDSNSPAFCRVFGKAPDAFHPAVLVPAFRHAAWNSCTKAHAEVVAVSSILREAERSVVPNSDVLRFFVSHYPCLSCVVVLCQLRASLPAEIQIEIAFADQKVPGNDSCSRS